MLRAYYRWTTALIVWLMAAAPQLPAQTRDLARTHLRGDEIRATLQILSQCIDMRDFRKPMSLKATLVLLSEKLAARELDLPILVDVEAFKNAGCDSIYDVPVRFDKRVDRCNVAQFLEKVLSQIPSATYVVGPHYLEITTSNLAWRSYPPAGLPTVECGPKGPAAISIPGALIANNGELGILTLPAGGMQAINIQSGKELWSNAQGFQPIILDCNHVLAMAIQAGPLRICLLDLRNGTIVRQTQRINMPSWAQPCEGSQRRFATHLVNRNGDYFFNWHAESWCDGLRLELGGLQAIGATWLSLRTGRSINIDLHDFPTSDPDEDAYFAGLRELRQTAVTPICYHGRFAQVLTKKPEGGKQAIALETWDIKRRKPSSVKTLLEGKFRNVEMTLDRGHLDVLGDDGVESILSAVTGKTVFTLKKAPPIDIPRLVIGSRLYGVNVSHGPLRQRNRRLVREQRLHFLDLRTGRKLWEREIEPFRTGLFTEAFPGLGLPGIEAIPSLLQALKDAQAHVRAGAAEDLGQMGAEARAAIPVLLDVLKDTDDRVRLQAAESLLRIDPESKAGFESLTAALKAPGHVQRALAVEALGALGNASEPVVAMLASLLHHDKEPAVRIAAAMALGRFRREPRVAVPALAAVLQDREEGVRFFAAGALARLGRHTRAILPELRAALRSDEHSSIQSALLCLRWHGDLGISELCDGVREVDDFPENIALQLPMVATATRKSVLTLIPLLSARNRDVQLQAALAIASLELKDKLEPIASRVWEIFSDGTLTGKFSEHTLRSLLKAYGNVGAQGTAVPALCEGLKDSGMKSAAVKTLGTLGARAKLAVPHLRKLMRHARDASCADAALALWRITGDADEPLLALSSFLNERAIRFDALVALGEMGPAAKSTLRAIEKLKTHNGLDQVDPALIALTVWRIGHRKDQAMQTLAQELATGKQPWILDEIAKLGPDAKVCVPALAAYLKSEKQAVRLKAAFARCRIAGCDGGALAVLTLGLDDPQHAVVAAKLLGELGPAARAASTGIVRALDNDDFDVYQATVRALNAVDPEAAAKAGVSLNPPRVRRKLTRAEFAVLWRDLNGGEPTRALLAQWQLPDTPAEVVAWIDESFPAVKSPAPKRLRQWLEDLKSPQFALREQAAQRLSACGELAEAGLRESLSQGGSLEHLRRLQKLLDELAPLGPRRQLLTRIIWTLEFHDTPEAARLLEQWSRDHPDAWRTQEARQAVERIRQRKK